MWLLWKVVILWVALVYADTQLVMEEQHMKTVTGKFCGSNLADTLSLLCKGFYNQRQKKDFYYPHYLDQNDDYNNDIEVDEESLKFPFKTRKSAKSIIPYDFRKRSLGIVDECCHKSCSLWEMKGYCGR